MREAGTYLTTKHGLSNLGQWHSHHRIHLFEPSIGDKNTVWNNMPGLGLDRYIVFIANITDVVKIDCFLFQIKYGQRLVKHGKFEFLGGNSPLRLNEDILWNVSIGAETFNEMTKFESEMQFLRNKDVGDENVSGYSVRSVGRHSGDLSNTQEKHTNSYTREIREKNHCDQLNQLQNRPKRSNKDASMSPNSNQMKQDIPHTQTSVTLSKVAIKQPCWTGKPKQPDNTSKQKLSVSNKPDCKREDIFLKEENDPSENNRNSPPPGYGNENRSRIHTNQWDNQQIAATSQSRNTVQNRGVDSTPQRDNRINPFPASETSKEIRREHEETISKTTPCDAKTSTAAENTRRKQNPSTREYKPGEQDDNEPQGRKNHGKNYNISTKTKDSSRQRDYDEETTQYQKIPRPTSPDTQKIQKRIPKDNNQVIVHQPKPSSGFESTSRKSGDYDNVSEPFQPKSSKPNPDDNNAESYDSQDTRPSTPSGTFPHNVDDQIETISRSCSTPHWVCMSNFCCIMGSLSITAQHSTDVKNGSQDKKDVDENEIPVTTI